MMKKSKTSETDKSRGGGEDVCEGEVKKAGKGKWKQRKEEG